MKSIWNVLPTIAIGTEQGKIEWETAGGTFFGTILDGKYFLQVHRWTDPDSHINGVTVELKNDKGSVLDEARADQFDPKYTELLRVYDLARRSGLDVETAIDDVEKVLARLNLR